MTVTYKNKLSDLWRFSIRNYFRGRTFLILNGLLILVFSYQLLSTATALHDTLLIKSLVFVTFLGLILASINLFTMLAVLVSYVPKLNKGIFTTHTVTLDESGVTSETPTSRGAIEWAGVLKVRQSHSFVYIYCAEHAAHVIPKRAFATPADAEGFFQFASQAHDASHAA